ncbi:hypothetical protein DRN85_03870 [Methanosarcinales archaeon]|nr:MAG: hypothetical protein DRN85_03870 [Methanosarcinales archaeon]
MASYYETNLQHISEELKRIDLMLHLQILKMRLKNRVTNEFGGFCISDEEIDAILDLDNTHPASESDDPRIQALKRYISDIKLEIELKKEESQKKGIKLKLSSLAGIFNLTSFEVDIILIGMASELDTKYERLYAYLQNDATKRQPGVDLILNLLCSSSEEKVYARQYFYADSSLFKNKIVQFVEDRVQRPLLSRFIRVDDRTINYLLGLSQIDEKIGFFSELTRIQTNLKEIQLSEELHRKILNFSTFWKKTVGRRTCFLQGPRGAGKKTIAQGVSWELDTALLIVDIPTLINREANFEESVSRIFREAVLQDSAVYLDHFERLFSEDAKNIHYKNILFKALEDYNGIAFIASDEVLELSGELQKDLFKIEIPTLDYEMRRTVWNTSLNRTFDREDISALANKFKFTAGQINDAITSAEKLAALEGRDDITIDDLYHGCRLQSNQKLTALAKRIRPKYGWGDIILPKEKTEQLREVTNYIKNKGIVYHDWGFDNKLSLGKGLNILFSGPSGTGKTMAAEVIASELGLDLYKIDLSMVVSKYIGETEKNLNRIFKEAEESNAILFFDEADALFGKRSEVQDSHDRYANIEINYLLQKMEENEGIVILATNLSKNIDDAFLRRMHFTIEFPFPEEEYRYKIWKSLFPEEAPLSDDIDYGFLAKRFKLSGGNIKNIVVNAAFLAAENSGVIAMEEVIKAAKREFQKIGKICSQPEFGKYYGLICKE